VVNRWIQRSEARLLAKAWLPNNTLAHFLALRYRTRYRKGCRDGYTSFISFQSKAPFVEVVKPKAILMVLKSVILAIKKRSLPFVVQKGGN
jgi:hypothetical protein